MFSIIERIHMFHADARAVTARLRTSDGSPVPATLPMAQLPSPDFTNSGPLPVIGGVAPQVYIYMTYPPHPHPYLTQIL